MPLAAQYASKGFTVIGCDIDQQVVETVNKGQCHIIGEPGLETIIAENVSAGRLRATTDTTGASQDSDVVVVIVPLIVAEDLKPDFRAIDSATLAVAKGLHREQLIIYETTLPVGTTCHRFGQALQDVSGLEPEQDFWLAFSPERVYSGRIFSDLQHYPKIVGGVGPISAAQAIKFYQRALDTEILNVESAEAAEFTKLIETTYRDVNIALANEFAQYAAEHGIDVTTAIQAANTQPFSHIHWPGVGVGGHCIPVYPYFLFNSHNGGENNNLRLPRLARSINDNMPHYAVDLLTRVLSDLADRRILILGLAYRENVKETAFTPAKGLIAALKAHGAQVLLNDPLFSPAEIETYGASSVTLNDPLTADAIILQSYHDAYRGLDLSLIKNCQVVLDGCNALNPTVIESLGMQYIGIGR